MKEIAPGVRWYTARRDKIGMDVSSYWLPEERVVLDPMIPAEGLDAFAEAPPVHVVMTNRHHDRDAWAFAERFGSTVHCIRAGLHEIENRGEVEAFDFAEELPGGIFVHEVGAICPDETALHIPARNALACADGVINYGGLIFVPDHFMDDPEDTKAALRAAYARLAADLEFDVLLLAHGDPVASGGREALREFAAA
jgi:glyoxylase-like metal-dependent hydrolase (beta-lactamase superfamily II)